MCLAYYFAPPIFSFKVNDPLDGVAIIAFWTTSAVITHLVSRARNRTEERLYMSMQWGRICCSRYCLLRWNASGAFEEAKTTPKETSQQVQVNGYQEVQIDLSQFL